LNLDAIDTVSVPDYILRGAVIRKRRNKLLRSPFRGWVNGFWFNDNESRSPHGAEAKEPNPEESVSRSRFWAIDGTFQDDDLVPESEDFGLERETRSNAGKEG